jgi:hypothetical protein
MNKTIEAQAWIIGIVAAVIAGILPGLLESAVAAVPMVA